MHSAETCLIKKHDNCDCQSARVAQADQMCVLTLGSVVPSNSPSHCDVEQCKEWCHVRVNGGWSVGQLVAESGFHACLTGLCADYRSIDLSQAPIIHHSCHS